jgi:hypothetical protein
MTTEYGFVRYEEDSKETLAIGKEIWLENAAFYKYRTLELQLLS